MYAIVRLGAWRDSAATARNVVSARAPIHLAPAAMAATAADGAKILRRPTATAADVLRPAARPGEVDQFWVDLLELLGRSEPDQRQTQIEQLVDGQDVATLRDLLAEEKSALALPDDVAQTMLKRLARADAPWTGDYLRSLPAGAFRSELLGAVLAQWGGDNLPAALAWAGKLGESVLQETAMVHLSYRWFDANPEGALAFAAIRPEERRQLLTTLVGEWSRQQPAAAAAWAAEFSSDPVMDGVAAGAVAAWAENDDLAAAEFVLKLPAGRRQQDVAIAVLTALAQKDPALGVQWIDVFRAGRDRDYAIETLAYRWATSDPTAALAWCNHLPAGERDGAVYAGAGGLIETKPELAVGWATAIQDESRRVQQTERAARHWLETDRAAAEAWIRQSVLPPETKLRLLAATPPRG
ncbi:MAG: hypothetical protein Q8N18_07940 [Opitutaceae bacterium]|nr:hypothetical protein [Opitutaceae bacterium]